MAEIILMGASGKSYTYTLAKASKPDKIEMPFAGNFVCAKIDAAGLDVIFAGETENLMSDAHRIFPGAVINYSATGLFVRPNEDRDARQAERDDIIASHNPIMNR